MATRVLSVLVLLSGTAAAQEFRSTISGRVFDPEGGAIPNVELAAIEMNTGARSETRSSGEGQYTIPFLLPGSYRLEAQATGFKRHFRSGVSLSANERKAVDITLELGAVSENVTVTAEAPLLETATASVGLVVTARQVETMPLNGRTPLMLAQLSATVIPLGGPGLTRPFDTGNTADFSVSGAPSRTNELLIDGSPNATAASRSAYSPPMDAVQELKVEAFQADAAFGNTGGGTVNVVMKSGTNSFHGSMYEYNQVSRLAATPFFSNRSGQKKPSFLWNQYGFTVGGPVILPRLFNGKDRLYYYFAFEGIKQPSLFPLAGTVPTAEMRRGDFSQLLRLNTSYQIYDPNSGVREGARVRRQPFAGNVIPGGLIRPIAQNILPFWPAPNQPGGADGRGNFFTNAPGREDYHNEIARMDFNASTRHKMFFNFRYAERYNISQQYFQNIARGRNLIRHSYGATFDDVYTFSPSFLLNSRLNWTRPEESRSVLSAGFDPTQLGFPASVSANSAQLMFPRVDVGGFEQLGESNHNSTPFDSFQIFASATRIFSRHSVKFGTDLRLYRESNYQPGNATGRYQFSASWTRGPLDSSGAAPLGQELAAFLLGLPTGGSYDLNATRTSQAGYWSFFVQDDFRPSPNLTLNLGLRYEREMPTTERFNRAVAGFDVQADTNITAAARAAYARTPIPEIPAQQFQPAGGLVFTGSARRSPYAAPSTNFSPRLGFAWSPSALGKKTVLRGGFGVFYFDFGIAGTGQPGFSQSTPLVPTNDGYLTPYATLANPFPDGFQQPTGSSQGVNTLLGRGVGYYNPSPGSPFSMRWNFNIQRTIAANAVVEFGYIGNRAVNLGVGRSLTYTPLQYLSTAPERDQATIDRLSGAVTNPFAGLLPGTTINGSVVPRTQLLQAFPHFTGVSAEALSDGRSYSHMALIRMEKRFSHGLEFQTNLMYSRIMQHLSRLNEGDDRLEKRIAAENRPLRWVVSASYRLPFLSSSRMLGGWGISGIFALQSGIPVEWGNVLYYGGDLNWNARNIDHVFDTSRFNTNARQQLASNIRRFPSAFGDLRGDRVNNFDAAISKDFPLLERVKLQFRCEFFNAFNHVLFDQPDVNPTSSTFGRVINQTNLPRRIQMALRLTW